MAYREIDLNKRFWKKVDKSGGAKACWPWQGSCHKTSKYGKFGIGHKLEYAHRVAYRLKRGKIPKGKKVLHECDNRICCNPQHLFLGTNQDNTDDMMKKGRANPARGEKHCRSKLTESDVRKIRKIWVIGRRTKTGIARQFGITESAVRSILSKGTWKHIVPTGRRVKPTIPKSLDEIIIWKPHMEESWHETFEPAVVPLRLLPRDIREHYTFKDIDLESAMCYPGKRRQIYGRAIKPHIYFVIQRKDGLKDAWAKLPNPSLRDMGPYWQKDLSIKFYKPWPW